jgi:hypothetical protein
MGHKNSEKRNDCQILDCQLQALCDLAEHLDFSDKVRRYYRRLNRAGRRRISKARKLLFPVKGTEVNGLRSNTITANKRALREGDLVEVLPFDDIRKTLDDHGYWGTMKFMEGMKEYCGRRLRILKKMNMMFDVHFWGMVRLKDTVILKDAVCDGKWFFEKEGCDRCCFYYWNENSLRKI